VWTSGPQLWLDHPYYAMPVEGAAVPSATSMTAKKLLTKIPALLIPYLNQCRKFFSAN
jgi:hypothetical protein